MDAETATHFGGCWNVLTTCHHKMPFMFGCVLNREFIMLQMLYINH